MSSLPTPSHMGGMSGPRGHRHRRSGAISGDFDAMGLGLFSSPQLSTSASSNQAIPINDDLDRHFHFDNEKDFTNKPVSSSFSFPTKSPDLSYSAVSPLHSLASPVRRPRPSSVLNSPIRMASQTRSSTNLNSPLTKFFMTEETNVDSHNVPDALIDLDDVLNSNLHIGDQSSIGNAHDDFLASPFIKPNSSPFISSPLSASNNTLFHRPIQESTPDAIAEEEDNPATTESDDDCEIFARAPNTLTDFYYNNSCNSSSSSLRSFSNKPTNQAIEKTYSNGSKDSHNSGQNQQLLGSLNTPPSKRSGAMANRYQSFYDQSYKISNALKVSSTESVNLTLTNSNDGTSNEKEKTLGHLKSLQSLKSTSNKRKASKGTLRFQDARVHYSSIAAPDTTNCTERLAVMNRLNSKQAMLHLEQSLPAKAPGEPIDQTLQTHVEPLLVMGKMSTNSPSSLKSETSSTILSANSTVQSTDHSSLQSSGDYNKLKSIGLNDEGPSTAPSIVVSTECDPNLSPSTDSTCHQFPRSNAEEEANESTQTSVILTPASEHTSPKKSPRREASPNEQTFLRSTQIPRFTTKEAPLRNERIVHRKSKSMSLILHRSLSALSNASEFTTLGSPEKRHRRFRDWFKKHV